MIEITHLPWDMSAALYNKSGLAEIRKESLDIYNRIHSITEDALFVEKVAEQYDEYPVIRVSRSLSLNGLYSTTSSQQT